MRSALVELSLGALVSPPRIPVRIGTGVLVFTVGGQTSGVAGTRIYHSLTPREGDQDELTVVFETATGKLKGIVVGRELGEWRTGAIGGLAIDLMAPRSVKNLGVLGTGPQAWTQTLAAMSVRNFEQIKVFSPVAERCWDFRQRVSGIGTCRTEAVRSPREAVEDADVLICATPQTQPVFQWEWLKPRAHINNIGPKKKNASELPIEAYTRAEMLATDSLAQLQELGAEFVLADTAHATRVVPLATLITDSNFNPAERSVFISQGLGGTEVLLAHELIRRHKLRQGRTPNSSQTDEKDS
jgi:ornithine cyclodeaminase/alanine dehydrogenase-like protein (mu-crystallin family)